MRYLVLLDFPQISPLLPDRWKPSVFHPGVVGMRGVYGQRTTAMHDIEYQGPGTPRTPQPQGTTRDEKNEKGGQDFITGVRQIPPPSGPAHVHTTLLYIVVYCCAWYNSQHLERAISATGRRGLVLLLMYYLVCCTPEYLVPGTWYWYVL